MKPSKIIYILVLFSLLVFLPSPSVSQNMTKAAQPEDIGEWQTGPFPPAGFQYARHDGAFVPGPALEPWANKVYFPGGRTSPGTEAPHIWMFDPLTDTYTDTGVDVVEDVSNYNANLILDDGTERGPAIYVIGGTDKDHGGVNIGTVQRYYPMPNVAEALPAADNWNGLVGGFRVAAMGTAVVNDIIYVFGGWQTSVAPYFSSQTWAFDPNLPSGSRWTNLGTPLSVARSYIMSATQDGKVYAIGGVGSYVNDDLVPVDTFEVLDTANLAAGWTQLAPMPAPGGEGRAFGFGSDSLKINSPYQGKLYVVAPNDWPGVSDEVMEYDVATDTWRIDLPELTTPRADLAGSFVPLCTSDPTDGLPGIWTFGGRVNESCDPPLGPVEFAPMACEACTELAAVEVHGPTRLEPGELGIFTPTLDPIDAYVPVTFDWSNDLTETQTTYSWAEEGIYTVVLTATNCMGTSVVTGTLEVVVETPCTALNEAEISGLASLHLGETGMYTVSLTPPDASPFSIQWSNGMTGTQAAYSWTGTGMQSVGVTASNCGGAVSAEFEVQVFQQLWLPVILRPEAK